MNNRDWEENYHLVTLITFLDACSLSSARNQENSLVCFSWSNSFQPSYPEDPNNHTQNLFARKEYVYVVQV